MGKGRQPAESNVSMGLPDYVDPYFKRLLKGAEEATMPFDPETGESTYTPYGEERLTRSADYADITGARDQLRGILGGNIPGMQEAYDTQRAGIAGLTSLAESPTAFTAGTADPYSGFTESQFTRGAGTEFDFGPARQFTGDEVQRYMDPYMQNVVDIQKREAIRDFDRGQAGRDASAVQAGAFGGSRQAVAQGMAEQNLQDRLGDIQQIGSQAAFDRAMQAFESDRAAEMGIQGSQAAEAARVQGIDIGELGRTESAAATEAARRQAAEAAELARTQGIDLNEAARVQAAQEAQRMGTAGLYGDLMGAGRGLVGLGELERGTGIQDAQMLETIGSDVRAEDQARLDLNYQDFLRQQDYPISQYERFAGLLSGVPTGSLDRTSMQYAAFNPIQAAMGTGLSALGLYRGLGYGGGGGMYS